jgi:hypothetical protein
MNELLQTMLTLGAGVLIGSFIERIINAIKKAKEKKE